MCDIIIPLILVQIYLEAYGSPKITKDEFEKRKTENPAFLYPHTALGSVSQYFPEWPFDDNVIRVFDNYKDSGWYAKHAARAARENKSINVPVQNLAGELAEIMTSTIMMDWSGPHNYRIDPSALAETLPQHLKVVCDPVTSTTSIKDPTSTNSRFVNQLIEFDGLYFTGNNFPLVTETKMGSDSRHVYHGFSAETLGNFAGFLNGFDRFSYLLIVNRRSIRRFEDDLYDFGYANGHVAAFPLTKDQLYRAAGNLKDYAHI